MTRDRNDANDANDANGANDANPSRDDDAALRALLVAPHVDEAGFAARITAALPPRRRRRLDRRVFAIAGGAVAAGICGAVAVNALETTLPFGSALPLAAVVIAVLWGVVEGARVES